MHQQCGMATNSENKQKNTHYNSSNKQIEHNNMGFSDLQTDCHIHFVRIILKLRFLGTSKVVYGLDQKHVHTRFDPEDLKWEEREIEL